VVFYVLGAPFVAALEVIVYAGAIMVLFVFVVMMLNLGAHEVDIEKQWLTPGIWVGPVVLAGILIARGHLSGARHYCRAWPRANWARRKLGSLCSVLT
jgi:NADH:ubiquinone oxidoreductase subunit 6 (subunit J)